MSKQDFADKIKRDAAEFDARIERLEQEHADMLAVLKDLCSGEVGSIARQQFWQRAREVIARAEGRS